MMMNKGCLSHFVVGVDEIMKLHLCNTFSGVLNKVCNQIDQYSIIFLESHHYNIRWICFLSTIQSKIF